MMVGFSCASMATAHSHLQLASGLILLLSLSLNVPHASAYYGVTRILPPPPVGPGPAVVGRTTVCYTWWAVTLAVAAFAAFVVSAILLWRYCKRERVAIHPLPGLAAGSLPLTGDEQPGQGQKVVIIVKAAPSAAPVPPKAADETT